MNEHIEELIHLKRYLMETRMVEFLVACTVRGNSIEACSIVVQHHTVTTYIVVVAAVVVVVVVDSTYC